MVYEDKDITNLFSGTSTNLFRHALTFSSGFCTSYCFSSVLLRTSGDVKRLFNHNGEHTFEAHRGVSRLPSPTSIHLTSDRVGLIQVESFIALILDPITL